MPQWEKEFIESLIRSARLEGFGIGLIATLIIIIILVILGKGV